MAVVLVVTSAPPVVEGGHLVIARALEQALREAGHDAGLVKTPSNRFGRQGSEYLSTWLTDVGVTGTGARVDRVITLRYPSYAVRHPNQICWLNHTMREYYDQWDTFSARLSPQGRLKERARRALIRAADTHFLKRHVRKLFSQSKTIQARIAEWNRVPSEVLYPPPPPRAYRTETYGDFFLFTSRLTPLKRASLLIRAMAEPAAASTRAVIVGEGEEEAGLRALARELRVDARVMFAGRVDDATLVDYLARCRAVVFPPSQEDYGFVTAEAFASAKAVVTTDDSGGPAELVRDGQNGLVVQPTPAALAAAIGRLAGDRPAAERMGATGKSDVASFTWPAVVARLMSA